MKTAARKTINANDLVKDRKAFYNRLCETCELLTGTDCYALFPQHSLKMMYAMRYPPIRVAPGTNQIVAAPEIRNFCGVLHLIFAHQQVKTLTGQQMSYQRFLSEALVLIHYVQYGLQSGFKGASCLFKAFAPYFTGQDWYQQYEDKIRQAVAAACLFLFDATKGTLWANTAAMSLVTPNGRNVIRLYRVPSRRAYHDIDGKKRALFRLGSPYLDQVEPEWFSLSASQLGLSADHEPKPLFIQVHALHRFTERTSLPAGAIYRCLSNSFADGKQHCQVRNGRVFVDCCTQEGYKIGYFVITPHEDKWIVRTFLFLTNETTPEGDRLSRIARLDRADASFLGIDRLCTFLTFDIGGDQQLRRLFTAAGCETLLNAADVIRSQFDEPLKSADHIHQYLSSVFLIGNSLPAGREGLKGVRPVKKVW